jgi:hypothetical protein
VKTWVLIRASNSVVTRDTFNWVATVVGLVWMSGFEVLRRYLGYPALSGHLVLSDTCMLIVIMIMRSTVTEDDDETPKADE